MCLAVVSKALDRYVHAMTVCSSLALLISLGSSKDFALRIALLTTLQKCWLNGHSVQKLVCSSDERHIDFLSSVVVHDSSADAGIQFAEDVNSLDIQPRRLCDDNNSDDELWSHVKSGFLNESNGVAENVITFGSGFCAFYIYSQTRLSG